MDKKGQVGLSDLPTIGITFVVTAIVFAFGLLILADTKADIEVDHPNSEAANATGDGITAVAKFPAKLGLIATVIIAGLIIGAVGFLMLRRR